MMKPNQQQHSFNVSSLNKFDAKTIKNLIEGKHNPADRLPYSMLVEVLRGLEYAKDLIDQLEANNNSKRSQLIEARRFLALHNKVINALCHHYLESSDIQYS